MIWSKRAAWSLIQRVSALDRYSTNTIPGKKYSRRGVELRWFGRPWQRFFVHSVHFPFFTLLSFAWYSVWERERVREVCEWKATFSAYINRSDLLYVCDCSIRPPRQNVFLAVLCVRLCVFCVSTKNASTFRWEEEGCRRKESARVCYSSAKSGNIVVTAEFSCIC